jgi:hypothetical protein
MLDMEVTPNAEPKVDAVAELQLDIVFTAWKGDGADGWYAAAGDSSREFSSDLEELIAERYELPNAAFVDAGDPGCHLDILYDFLDVAPPLLEAAVSTEVENDGRYGAGAGG